MCGKADYFAGATVTDMEANANGGGSNGQVGNPDKSPKSKIGRIILRNFVLSRRTIFSG
jgi:hypothetical protein